MKFAVIGSDHAHVFRFVEHMKAAGGVFAGVWEDGHPHTRRLMDEYGAQAYPSWESVLAEHPGIVGCFAPNGRRMEIVEACSAAGIPVMSDKPLEELAVDLEKVDEVARGDLNISKEIDPVTTLCFMALPVIPEVKITDMGLFDVTKFAFMDIEAE